MSISVLMVPSYILGKEFRALFMSTTEPVDVNGKTTNPTKSLCDRYVFNTVLTRSKSLVVVVGSPCALLRIEQHMQREQGMCWSLYMQRCIENKSFIIPPSVEPNKSKQCAFLETLTKLCGGAREVAMFPQPKAGIRRKNPPLSTVPLSTTMPKPKSKSWTKMITGEIMQYLDTEYCSQCASEHKANLCAMNASLVYCMCFSIRLF